MDDLIVYDLNARGDDLSKRAVAEIERLRADLDWLEEALHRIDEWSRAYPLSVFSEPDLKKAAAVLEANGITLDSISAHCMRHVVEGVGKIARNALGGRIKDGSG